LCIDCHAVSEPGQAGVTNPTQGTTTASLSGGSTSTNAAQWMNHAQANVAGKDCSTCHAADAKSSGSAWSKADSFHPKVASPSTCQNCHGLTNGKGAVVGTNNNLPAGLVNSATTTTASADPTTGVPSG